MVTKLSTLSWPFNPDEVEVSLAQTKRLSSLSVCYMPTTAERGINAEEKERVNQSIYGCEFCFSF